MVPVVAPIEIRAKDIRMVKLANVRPNPKNRNQHPDEQIARLAQVYRYQGFREPIIISNQSGLLVCGHGRILAAKLAGLLEVPAMYQDFESPEQEYAHATADNALPAWAELDLAGINTDVPDLGPDFDIDLLGIRDFTLDVSEKYEGDPDAVPEPPKMAKTKRGELWTLGAHRFLIEDCTVSENMKRLMGDERAALWSSDPPYGINHVATSQEKGQSDGYADIANDDLQFDELKSFLEKAIRASIDHGLRDGFAFYMWHAMKMQSYAAAAAAAAAGILFHRQIIWVKPSLVFGRGQYHWRHELCLMGWLQGNECPFYGERNQTTVWEVGRENDKIHPTQKPVTLTEAPITNHTKPGDIVLDPFLGSGSTIMACEKTARRGFGLELNPVYADVILTRWAKFTGKDPVREDGVKWSELNG